MSDNNILLNDNLLRDGAFLLLSSSSVNRYINVAFSLGKVSSILTKIEMGKLSFQDILARARFLWRDLLRKPYRDVGEVELATILAIIANIPEPDVPELLNIIAMTDKLQVAWLSALARYLYQHHAGNLRLSLEGFNIDIVIMQRNLKKDEASNNQEVYFKPKMNLLWKSKASSHIEFRLAA